MSHNKKDRDLIVAVLDTFLFPVFRISRALFSDKSFMEQFVRAKGHMIYDLCATIFLGVLLYYMGRITIFGNQFTFFWYVGGCFAFVLGVSFLIGKLRRQRRQVREDGSTYYDTYEKIKQVLKSMGYTNAEATESADYVMSKYANEEMNNKIIYALSYFGK